MSRDSHPRPAASQYVKHTCSITLLPSNIYNNPGYTHIYIYIYVYAHTYNFIFILISLIIICHCTVYECEELRIVVSWPCGLMDKALVFGTKDCRFESCQGHIFYAANRTSARCAALAIQQFCNWVSFQKCGE